MEKKVAVVTICDPNPNYGNALQNYASILYFRSKGMIVSTLVSEPQNRKNIIVLKMCLNIITRYKRWGRERQLKFRRIIKFTRFAKHFLNYNSAYIKNTFIPSSFDYYAIGSDQVWNPNYYYSYSKKKDLFLLSFAKPEQIICNAPSFGVSELPQEWKPWFKENLEKYPTIAVREEAGSRIISDLLGRTSEILPDPTLLICTQKWRKLESLPKHVDVRVPFVVTYFLGKKSKDIDSIIQENFEQTMTVYHLNDTDYPFLYCIGPQEFLYMIDHSKLVLTDSFHACVFSFLFEKPFLVFDRESEDGNMNSRIQTLLSKYSLERKYYSSGLENCILENDYSLGLMKLKEERDKAEKYYNSSFNRCNIKE